MKWITKDRRRLDPRCMTCEHLRNCVNKIMREQWRMRWLSTLLGELNRRCLDKPKIKKEEHDTISA